MRTSRPPRGGRGLKSSRGVILPLSKPSPPSRGAWIEIKIPLDRVKTNFVAPLAGGVD